MIYSLQYTTQFRKDCKLMKKRGWDLQQLETLLNLLCNGDKLPEHYCDHALIGNYAGFRECHIAPDWLLIYYVQNDRLVLVCARTGSHSDLFR